MQKLIKIAAVILSGSAFFGCSPNVKFSEVTSVAGLAAIDLTCSSEEEIRIPAADLDLHCHSEDQNKSPAYFDNDLAKFYFPRNQNPKPPETVPASCLSGFEVNNLAQKSFTFRTFGDGTTEDRVLEVDLGTYAAPDSVRMTAKNKDGTETIIFDSCHIRTSCYVDPSGGTKRPYEESLRSFRVPIRRGTVSITLDNSLVETPTYVRILGICEFDLSQLPPKAGNKEFRLVAGRPVSPMGEKNQDSTDQY